MPEAPVTVEIVATGSTVLTTFEQARAQQVLRALPGITTEINVTGQARTVRGLLDALTTTGQHLQDLYDQMADLEAKRARTARDVEGLRRILGVAK